VPARAESLEVSRGARQLRVGGITPLSATDYPGFLSAVVFCQGCPWRCGYCHNPYLLRADGPQPISWDDTLAFLRRRQGLLDAVVFSGGEPLAQTGLAAAMREVRRLGFRVGLHTGGAYPLRLAAVLPLVDWVGFDVKTAFADYERITGVNGSGEPALASARLIVDSGVACEFRTTVHPGQHDGRAIEALAAGLAALGVRHYVLQAFRREGCADPALLRDATPSFLGDALGPALAPKFASFAIRGA
jgi:pyruvate formate lyase activating enzyme